MDMTRYVNYLPVLMLSIGLNMSALAEPRYESTELGTILGTVVGGLVGYQFGGGSGKYVSTAVGAAIGSNVGRNIHHNQNQKQAYQPEYVYPVEYESNYYHKPAYVAQDDYLIKQQLSDARKRRNMIRNGEIEEPYDVSNVQTSWDDPEN